MEWCLIGVGITASEICFGSAASKFEWVLVGLALLFRNGEFPAGDCLVVPEMHL